MTHDSLIDRLDPRVRLIACVAVSLFVALAQQRPTLIAALALAVAVLCIARVPLAVTARRLAALNVFVVMLLVVLPLTAPGGLDLAIDIALRANSIVIVITAMLATMTLPTLGHTLHHLKAPDKLVGLLLMCVRYIDVLQSEYARLRRAMKVRGFRPKMNRHTYRSIGYLVGMLLVRSFDRAERIAAAMKCRGFHGHFHLLHHFHAHRRDAAFAALTMSALAALIWLELS